MSNKKLVGFFGVALVVVGAGLFTAGWFGKPEAEANPDDEEKLDMLNILLRDTFAEDGARNDMAKVNGTKISQFLSDYASLPHMAGLDHDEHLAQLLKDKWLEMGLDQVPI